MTDAQVRLLCVGLALAQVVAGATLWLGLPVADGVTAHYWLAGAMAMVASLAVVLFMRGFVLSLPFDRVERDAAIALAVSPAWAVVFSLTIPGAVVIQQHDTTGLYELGIYADLIVLHMLPAMLMARTVHARLGTKGSDWSPHEASNAERGWALLGVSTLTGGWTALLGLIGFGMVYGLGHIDLSDVPEMAISAAVVHGFGSFMGLLAAAISSTIPARTRLDRSVPQIFLPAMGVGAVSSAIFLPLGVPAAAVTLLVMCLVTQRTCRLYAAGHCQQCDYDLRGLIEPVCPECGEPLADDASGAGPVQRSVARG